jgi:hypothetical protein
MGKWRHSSAIDFGNRWKLSVSRPGRVNPMEMAAGTHGIGDWVGPTDGMGAMENKIYLSPAWNRTPVVQPAAQ